MPEPVSFLNIESPHGDLAIRYLHAMLSREQKQGRDLILDAVERGHSVKEIYLNVFQPVMYEVGRLWQTGKISVGQEHYCTNATQVTMSMLYPILFKNPVNGKRLLATCVQGELHELGLRMVADFFTMDGWNTDYLGANTPYDSIVREIEEKSTDVLAIGITMFYHLEKTRKMIEAVRRVTDAGKIKILLGGYTIKIDETLWRTLGADGTAENAQKAIALANKFIAKVDKCDNA